MPVQVVARDAPTWRVVFEQTVRWVELAAFLWSVSEARFAAEAQERFWQGRFLESGLHSDEEQLILRWEWPFLQTEVAGGQVEQKSAGLARLLVSLG